MLEQERMSTFVDNPCSINDYISGASTGFGRRSKGADVDIRVTADNEVWVETLRKVRDDKDEAAFAELFKHFAPRVKSFLRKSGCDTVLAEECVQDVMAVLWHKSHLFDPTRATVATWVFTIARNKQIDVLRKQKRPEPEELFWYEENEPDHAERMQFQQEAERLSVAIKELPEKQRQLIEQAFYGDKSHSEIANETGLPLGTIKSRIRLAIQRLRHTMR